MADLSKTVAIVFDGQDNTGDAISSISRQLSGLEIAASGVGSSLKKFSQGVEDATQPIANFTLGAVKLEAGILAAGTAVTLFAVKSAGDFDAAFRQITTLFDASTADVARFRDAVQQYAASSSKSLDDVMGSFSAAIGAGVKYTDSIALITTAEKLAVATRADLKGTTEVLVSTINSYGMSMSDAGKVSDILFQVIKDGKIEMSDLSRSLAMVTPIAAASGVSLKEIGAAIATLTASGVQPSQAIEYLRSAISNIIKPSKEAADTAQELGIKFDAQTLKTKGLSAMFDDMARATGGSTEKLSKLVGDVGGLTAVLILALSGNKAFKESLENMGNAAGATGDAYAKMAGDLEQSIGKLKSAFTGLMINIGTPLMDEAGSIAAAIAKIFNAIGMNVKAGALGNLVAYVEEQFKGLASIFDSIAANLTGALERADLSGFKRGIEAVKNAFGLLFSGIDLTSVSGLTRAIELAGAAFLGLSNFTAGVVESFKPAFDWLVKMADGLAKADEGFFKTAGSAAGFVTQANILATGLNDLMPAITALVEILIAKQGFNLLSSLGMATVGSEALIAVLTGPAGQAMAIAGLSFEVGKLVQALLQWKDASDRVKESQKTQASLTQMSAEKLDDFSKSTGFVVKNLDEAIKLIDSGMVVWDEATKGWVRAEGALTDVEKGVYGFGTSLSSLDQKTKDAAASSTKLADSTGAIVSHGIKMVPIIDEATGKITGYNMSMAGAAPAAGKLADSSKAAASALDETGKAADKAKEKADSYKLKMEEIASNERIKTIEARVQLNIAQLQADTEKVKAIFASIDNTVNSTGSMITSLFDKIGNYNLSSSDYYDIKDQIALENERRGEALELQKQLTLATIEEIKARTQSMINGDALIKIDGAGLQPHLEAFMWEILKTIQTRVNRDGLKMLLGV